MSNKMDEPTADKQAWKNKVKSVDSSLRSMRGGPKDKPKAPGSKRKDDSHGKGLFGFLHTKPPIQHAE